MKRYRLKKDMKYVKSGAVFIADSSRLVCPYGPRTIEISKDVPENFPGLLEEWFEEIREEPRTVFYLKKGDVFWIIREGTIPGMAHWTSNIYYEKKRAIGDVFLTLGEAQRELARRKAKQILLRDTKGFKPDWHSNRYNKYEVYYEYCTNAYLGGNLFVNDCNHCTSHSDLWFASREDAEASIKAHEKEWLCYLNVEN